MEQNNGAGGWAILWTFIGAMLIGVGVLFGVLWLDVYLAKGFFAAIGVM